MLDALGGARMSEVTPEQLADIELFSQLPGELRSPVAQQLLVTEVPAGEVLIAQDDLSTRCSCSSTGT